MRELLVPARFNGPPGSANGGFVAGRMAGLLDTYGPVQVTLRQPPPLEVPMAVGGDWDRVELSTGNGLIAEAVAIDDAGEVVPPVPFAVADAARRGFAGLRAHPFPTCFVCGTQRPLDDGLRVWAGPIRGGDADGRGRVVATSFVPRTDATQVAIGTGPDPVIGPELIWSALDCPAGWSSLTPGRPAVLGRMTAVVHGLPSVGEECVVLGVLDDVDGRKSFTRSTAYGTDGRELGRARATWIATST